MGNLSKLVAMGIFLLLFVQISAADAADDLIEKGNSYRSAGRYDEAFALYDQAILANPNESSVYLPKYDLLRKTGRFEEAREVWENVMDTLPTSTEPIYYYSFVAGGSMMCAEYHSKGKEYIIYHKDYEEALFYFGRVHELCPADTDIGNVYADEGYALYKLGRYDESLAAYDEALQISREKLASDPEREEYITNNKIITFNREMIADEMNAAPADTLAPPATPAAPSPGVHNTEQTTLQDTHGPSPGAPFPWYLSFAVVIGFILTYGRKQ